MRRETGSICFNQANDMKIIYLQLYVLICSGAAVLALVTDLGSDVIINCDLDENDVYWIFLKTPDPPTVILRSFSTSTSPHYFNKTFIKKYSVQFKHRLVINNVTADELGIYYCMKTGTPPKLSNSTTVCINEQTPQTESHNQTVKLIKHNQTELEFNDQKKTQCLIIIIISGLMNGLLLLVMIGLVKVFVIGRKMSEEQAEQFNSRHNKTTLQQTQVLEDQDPDQLQYATMDFSKMHKKFRSSQINSTYAALNLPKS